MKRTPARTQAGSIQRRTERTVLWLAAVALAALGLAVAQPPAARAQSPATAPGNAAPGNAPAADTRELIAVLDLQPVGASPVEASALTDRLREELFKTGRFRLIDRSQIDAVMAEQALQQAGCTEQECAVQVGRILGVRKIVAGKLTRISPRLWQLSVLMVDVETTETIAAESIQHRGEFFDLLTARVPPLAARLAGDHGGAIAPAAVQAPPEPEPAPAEPEAAGGMVYRVGFAPVALRSVTLDETDPALGGSKEQISSTGVAFAGQARFPNRWGARFVLYSGKVNETDIDGTKIDATGTMTGSTLAGDYTWLLRRWTLSLGGGVYSTTTTYTVQDAQLNPANEELELDVSGLAVVFSADYRFANNVIVGGDLAGGVTGTPSGSRVEGQAAAADAKRNVTSSRFALYVGYQFGGTADGEPPAQ